MENLCDDLLSDILLRLPLKSAVKCKCINKKFNTFISDPEFIENLSVRNSSIIHTSYLPTPFFYNLFLYPHHQHPDPVKPNTGTGNSVELPCHCPAIAYSNGLLLLRLSKKPTNRILILNPVTKRYKLIGMPDPEYPPEQIGLAVEPLSFSLHQYKVVCINIIMETYRETRYGFETFSSQTNSWRESDTILSCRTSSKFFSHALPVYSQGSLHWLRECNDIVAFDVETEHAKIINLPQSLTTFTYKETWLGVSQPQGKLTLISAKSREEIVVWTLDSNKNSECEWVVTVRITNLLDRYSKTMNPIIFDGRRLVLHQRHPMTGEIRSYDVLLDKWRKIGYVSDYSDNLCPFLPFVPSFAEVKGVDLFYNQSAGQDLPFEDGSIIHKLTLLVEGRKY